MQPVLIGIGAYLVVQFAVGMLVSRRIASESDYLLAGRRLGLALGRVLDLRDLVRRGDHRRRRRLDLLRRTLGRLGRPVRLRALPRSCSALVVAAPLWRRQYTTFGDLFRERYSPGVERLAVLLMVPTSVLWAAAQIRAFGQVVSASSDLEVIDRDHRRRRLRHHLHRGRRPARRRRDGLRAEHCHRDRSRDPARRRRQRATADSRRCRR